MSFERYLAEQIEKIAGGQPEVDPKFKPLLKLYLKMIEGGMSVKAAKAVMNWYMGENRIEGGS